MKYDNYLSVIGECPECNGEGQTERMIMLTYSGAQDWRIDQCDTCGGTGQYLFHVLCCFCGDEILIGEEGATSETEGKACHAFCLEQSYE